MADALDSKSSEGDLVRVQVPPSAPETTEIEPELHIRKRVCGFYRWKVRKKHKVKMPCAFSIAHPRDTHGEFTPTLRVAKTDFRRHQAVLRL